MRFSGWETSWQKIKNAYGHFFSSEGRNFIRRYLRHELAVPLFMLQSRFKGSHIPAPAGVCIEITNRCNLNCLMCVRRYWDAAANPLGEMSYEFFEKNILVHLKPYQSVNLQGVGESLLSKNFLPMLRACKDLGCETTFITNGVSLQHYADDIVSIGVDEIRLSVDGTESMQKIRRFSIDKVMAALDDLNAAKQKLGKKHPAVYINYVLTRDTLYELPELIEMVRAREVSKIFVMHMIIHDPVLIDQSVVPLYVEAKKVFAEAAALAKRHGIFLDLPPEPETRCICYQPFRFVFINWNGDVRPCCMSTINEKGALLLGNLQEQSLPELWNSAYAHKLRKALITGKGMPEICNHCPMRAFDLESHIHLFTDESGTVEKP